MGKAKVWKMGDKWAGISARGKRVVKSTKSAAESAVGITGSRSKSSGTKNKKKVRKTAKKKTKRRYKMTIPIAPITGLAVGMIEPARKLIKGDILGFVDKMAYHYLGLSGVQSGNITGFSMKGLMNGLVPLGIGLLAHKVIGGYLGLNRMLGRAKVPLLRL